MSPRRLGLTALIKDCCSGEGLRILSVAMKELPAVVLCGSYLVAAGSESTPTVPSHSAPRTFHRSSLKIFPSAWWAQISKAYFEHFPSRCHLSCALRGGTSGAQSSSCPLAETDPTLPPEGTGLYLQKEGEALGAGNRSPECVSPPADETFGRENPIMYSSEEEVIIPY